MVAHEMALASSAREGEGYIKGGFSVEKGRGLGGGMRLTNTTSA
jgi:hypothetical protein